MQLAIESIQFDKAKAAEIPPDSIKRVAESIQEKGLIHPVTVRPENGSYVLAQGLKRVLAHLMLGKETIEVDVREMNAGEAHELSIHENLKRENLPWFEEIILIEELHNLRQIQHGAAKPHRPKADEPKGWSVRDTAEELGRAFGPISEDINLAKAVRNDPSLRNVKDKETAKRLVKVAARRANAEIEALDPDKFAPNEVYNGSAREILSHFDAASFDGCITDPPWLKYIDSKLTRDDETVPVFKEVYRVLKADSFLYVIVGIDDFIFYQNHLPKLGFQVSKTPLIWKKTGSMTRLGVRPWEYGRDFELILLAVKGSPALTSSVQQSAIFDVQIVPPRSMVHPHEKPVELIERILEDCTYQGSTILDPFGGSGVLGTACKNKGRSFAIIERDHGFYMNIRRRLGLELK